MLRFRIYNQPLIAEAIIVPNKSSDLLVDETRVGTSKWDAGEKRSKCVEWTPFNNLSSGLMEWFYVCIFEIKPLHSLVSPQSVVQTTDGTDATFGGHG